MARVDDTWVTVVDVAKSIGVEPDNDLMWSVGSAVRIAWHAEKGRLPEKALRPKTRGKGSHCFAVYPPNWRPRIETAIKGVTTEQAKQGGLFNGH